MSEKMKTGSRGEALAAEFLQQHGFTVVARNYRHRHAEIDLIVQRNDWLVFVEVKTRRSTDYGEPEDFIGYVKVNALYDAAEAYIYDHDWQGHVRFDVVSVKLGDKAVIDHFEDAIH